MTQVEASKAAPKPRTGGPWDQRLARFLVRPLAKTPVTPNHMTTVRFVLGLVACGLLAVGHGPWIHYGAGLFAVSNFVDHMDGELARLSGRMSRIGHLYDIAVDAFLHVVLFICIAYGLRDSWLGEWALPIGAIAGVSVSGCFWLFQWLEERTGQKQAGLPRFKGFEIEDAMYLIGPATWSGGLIVILLVGVVGAPAFGLWGAVRHRRVIWNHIRGRNDR